MSFQSWKPYVPVAKRREQAAKKLAKMKKDGATVSPIAIEGRTIAKSFWGKAWCTNLEHYSDYANRLPRGRTYVRNGSVLDLAIAKGEVLAMVSGSEIYSLKITIAPVAAARWTAIAKDCAGSMNSLVELLQGKLDKGVMDRVCRPGDGLFPVPSEIKLSCSCPDWADMCKHVAAALYGIGARLDQRPELLFELRGVDAKDLIAGAGADLPLAKVKSPKGKVLISGDMAALFGLDMAEASQPQTISAVAKPPRAAKPAKIQARRATPDAGKTRMVAPSRKPAKPAKPNGSTARRRKSTAGRT